MKTLREWSEEMPPRIKRAYINEFGHRSSAILEMTSTSLSDCFLAVSSRSYVIGGYNKQSLLFWDGIRQSF